MPRTPVSQAATIVNFFRTSSLETADLILALCKDTVAERKAKSNAAKTRATIAAVPPPVATASAPVKRRRKPGPKKGSKRAPRAATATVEVEPGLPLVEEYGEPETELVGQ